MTPGKLRTVAEWAILEADAHHVDVQAVIRNAIRFGQITVRPKASGGIRITPIVVQEERTVWPNMRLGLGRVRV